jgi:hypothetical protein
MLSISCQSDLGIHNGTLIHTQMTYKLLGITIYFLAGTKLNILSYIDIFCCDTFKCVHIMLGSGRSARQ